MVIWLTVVSIASSNCVFALSFNSTMEVLDVWALYPITLDVSPVGSPVERYKRPEHLFMTKRTRFHTLLSLNELEQ